MKNYEFIEDSSPDQAVEGHTKSKPSNNFKKMEDLTILSSFQLQDHQIPFDKKVDFLFDDLQF